MAKRTKKRTTSRRSKPAAQASSRKPTTPTTLDISLDDCRHLLMAAKSVLHRARRSSIDGAASNALIARCDRFRDACDLHKELLAKSTDLWPGGYEFGGVGPGSLHGKLHPLGALTHWADTAWCVAQDLSSPPVQARLQHMETDGSSLPKRLLAALEDYNGKDDPTCAVFASRTPMKQCEALIIDIENQLTYLDSKTPAPTLEVLRQHYSNGHPMQGADSTVDKALAAQTKPNDKLRICKCRKCNRTVRLPPDKYVWGKSKCTHEGCDGRLDVQSTR